MKNLISVLIMGLTALPCAAKMIIVEGGCDQPISIQAIPKDADGRDPIPFSAVRLDAEPNGTVLTDGFYYDLYADEVDSDFWYVSRYHLGDGVYRVAFEGYLENTTDYELHDVGFALLFFRSTSLDQSFTYDNNDHTWYLDDKWAKWYGIEGQNTLLSMDRNVSDIPLSVDYEGIYSSVLETDDVPFISYGDLLPGQRTYRRFYFYRNSFSGYEWLGFSVSRNPHRALTLTELEVTGPNTVWDNSCARYRTIARYENNVSLDVTHLARWWIEPDGVAGIYGGHLVTPDTNGPQQITVYARYVEAGAILQAQMPVTIYPHVEDAILRVPSEYSTIQAAIDAASNGDVVVVGPKTYAGDGNRDLDFHGKTITVRSIDPGDPEIVAATVIDCNGSESENHLGFVFQEGTGPDSILAGLTITNGYAYGGGAVLCYRSAPTILQCAFQANTGSNHGRGGGAVRCCWSSPTIVQCSFIGNVAPSGGAIVSSFDGSPTIYGCAFSGNAAYSGGAVASYSSQMTLVDCTFKNNSATYGGAIRSDLDTVIFIGCTFRENSAQLYGGALATEEAHVLLTDCRFRANLAGSYGGALHSNGTTASLTNCLFISNLAHECGGAIFSTQSTLNLTNCTITRNGASQGRALCCDPGLECTWVPSPWWPWGYWDCPTWSNIEATNCILWDGGDEVLKHSSSTVAITYSNVQDGYDGEGNIDADPCFAFPMDCHLMPESPCIDAGTNAPSDGLADTDMEGTVRVLDGDGDGNSVVDMGAFEHDPNGPWIAVSSRQFQLIKGHTDCVQDLHIRNCGGGTLNWQIVEDCNWLQASPASGVSAGDINEVAVIVDYNGLTRGYYQCTLAVTDAAAANNPVTIDVSLYVPGRRYVPDEYATIQAAIDAAGPFDIVVIEPNTYTGDGNRDLDFRGKRITVRSTDPNDPNIVAATILDCNGTEADPHRGFYFRTGEDGNSVVEGLTIINGYAPPAPVVPWPEAPSPPCWGTWPPGETNEWPPDITCPPWPQWICDMAGLDASGEVDSASPQRYTEVGGGICCLNMASLTGGYGPTIRKCVIANVRGGGGIYGSGGPIIECIVTNNTPVGLWNCSGSITHCTITGNIGGGVWASTSPITNCVITANRGRGTSLHFGAISNCLVSGNKGGGIGTYGGTISNCTIAGNYSAYGGGGVRVNVCPGCPGMPDMPPPYEDPIWWPPTTTVRIAGSVIWANKASAPGKQLGICAGAHAAVSYCDIRGGPGAVGAGPGAVLHWGVGNIDSEPWFVEPGYWAHASDPTVEVEPNDPNAVWIQGDYHLLRLSPCIDAGDNNSIAPDVADLDGDGNTAEPTPLDLDLSPRVIDARNDCNAAVDMGAYETVPEPQVFYVDDDANGANDGTSWQDAFNYLQDGLDAAVIIGDQIWVAEGLYTPDCNSGDPGGTGERTASFELKKGVAVKGGFAGAGAPDPNARDFSTYETVLSGDLNGDDGPGFANNGENCHSVVSANSTDENTILDGVTITGGNADDRRAGYYKGGGIWLENGVLTVRNCKLRSNYGMMGGAVASLSSSPTFVSCLFCGNKAVGGAAMHNESGSPSLMNCTLTGNVANTTGGIVSRDTGRPTLANCILWRNQDLGGSTEASQIGGRAPFVDYCCVQGWTGSLGGVGNMGEDPCFVAAGSWDSNGVWHEGDYHLPPESPCIDAGDPCYASGPDEPDLDGKVRVVGGSVDMGAYELALPPLDAHLWLLPGVIRRCGRLPRVMAWVILPRGITKDQVDGEQLLVLNPGQVQAVVQYVIELRLLWARRTSIFAFFDKDELMGVIADNGKVELQVCGTLTSGQQFCGTDTVWISARACRYLAAFASYWLRADCGVPDWCGGFDLDQDGTVNFADFAPSE